MLNSQIINKVYEKMLDIILVDIDSQDKDFVAEGYYRYLNKVYQTFDFSNIDFDKALDFVKNSQIKEWENTSIEYRLKKLTIDDSFDKLKKLSSLSYSYAIKKLSGEEINIDKKIIDGYIDELRDLLSKVKKYNIHEANGLVSEGILDFTYVSRDTDITSLRIGNIKMVKHF